MHDEEIISFTDSIQLAQNKFYVDAIHKFQGLIDKYPESDLADDAMFNIALCYYEMCQFQKSIDTIEAMIEKYPESTISALEGANEFGKTAAKGYYLIIQCYIGLSDVDKAKSYLENVKAFDSSYIMQGEEKLTFYDLSINAIDTYNEIS